MAENHKMRTLETERLILRKFEKSDFTAVHSYASCLENVIYMPWGPNTEKQTRKFINRAISEANEKPCVEFHFAIVCKSTSKNSFLSDSPAIFSSGKAEEEGIPVNGIPTAKSCGSRRIDRFVGVKRSQAEKGRRPGQNEVSGDASEEESTLIGACSVTIDVSGDTAEIGWIIHRDFWKQGYGTEMGKALLGFGFDGLGLRRIVAHCDAENQGSWRLMEKIGMRREGFFVENHPAYKGADRRYGDELSYAVLAREWVK